MLDTRKLIPQRLEISVALYKMYAYSNRFDASLELVHQVLTSAEEQGGFPPDWQILDSSSANWREARGAVRFYLYSMKAMGLVLLRKGEVDKAFDVLKKLCDLDPEDQVGGSVVYAMAERLLEPDEASVA